MPAGLQLFNPNRDGTLVLDITTRFTNLIGYVDLPVYYWDNYSNISSMDFSWKSITVHEFGTYGEPFWCAFNRARQQAIKMGTPPGYKTDIPWVDAVTNRCLSDYSPECYVSGNTLFYRYPEGVAWAPGDYAFWAWGGHRLLYGVC